MKQAGRPIAPPSVEPADAPGSDGPLTGVLPETIGSDDLKQLNQALGTLFGLLREARQLSEGNNDGRAGAIVVLRAAWIFLTRFRPASVEGLHIPLQKLSNALLALNNNSVEPILKPTKRTGRAVSSPMHFGLIGIAVGTAQRLECTGMTPTTAEKAVAAKLAALGTKSTRGEGRITARTLRGWREGIDATGPLLLSQEINSKDLGWVTAVNNAHSILTDEWRSRLQALAPDEARRWILSALENSVRKINLD